MHAAENCRTAFAAYDISYAAHHVGAAAHASQVYDSPAQIHV